MTKKKKQAARKETKPSARGQGKTLMTTRQILSSMTYNDPTAPVKDSPPTIRAGRITIESRKHGKNGQVQNLLKDCFGGPIKLIQHKGVRTCSIQFENGQTLHYPIGLIDDIPMFQSAPLASKFYRKGDPPDQFFHLRKSPQGYLYLYCKKTCEFVRELTVDMHFTTIG
jgi:hypothetical protein